LLRGYALGDQATQLLTALALFKVRRFLSTGLRLRSACDLIPAGDLVATQPAAFTIPDEGQLLKECQRLIAACKSQFAGVTTVSWEPATKKKSEEAEGEEKE